MEPKTPDKASWAVNCEAVTSMAELYMMMEGSCLVSVKQHGATGELSMARSG